jgi:hypothetical protein
MHIDMVLKEKKSLCTIILSRLEEQRKNICVRKVCNGAAPSHWLFSISNIGCDRSLQMLAPMYVHTQNKVHRFDSPQTVRT